MAKIAQPSLFHWQEIEELGDLERLQLLLDHLPDERLMCELEKRRGNGRDDYPIRPLWNSLLSCIVFQHVSIEGLRRELKRNGQLRWIWSYGQELCMTIQAATSSTPSVNTIPSTTFPSNA